MEGWPKGTWDVVLIDPPWRYPVIAANHPTLATGAAREYPLMSDQDIFDLPVGDLFAPQGMLFCWATCPRLDTAIHAIEEWGLYYRAVAFVWVKTRKDGAPIGAQGVRPSVVKPTTELVLAASKGKRKLSVADATIRQVVMAPKREHSRKPDEVQERIERLYPQASRIELFARRRREGWDAWGNEVDTGDPIC